MAFTHERVVADRTDWTFMKAFSTGEVHMYWRIMCVECGAKDWARKADSKEQAEYSKFGKDETYGRPKGEEQGT